jgi:hypothetical protein
MIQNYTEFVYNPDEFNVFLIKFISAVCKIDVAKYD